MKIKLVISMGVCALVWTGLACGQQEKTDDKKKTPANVVAVMKDNGGVVVTVDGKLFTRYDYRTFEKPVLFPVYGPGQVEMTRNFPMKKVAGEADDHLHHKSIWIGHEINGVDFWSNKTGIIKNKSIAHVDSKKGSFWATNDWVRKRDNSVVCTEQAIYTFGADSTARWIDAEIILTATNGQMIFRDSKEGFFAIRTHPALRLKGDAKQGVASNGKAINSSGKTGAAIWGQPAEWVNYWGKVGEKQVGVAMMDHPDNLRHPTTWHARDYGLIAANPFGQHQFQKKPKGEGAHLLHSGGRITFKYRIVFHAGEHDAAKIKERFSSFAKK